MKKLVAVVLGAVVLAWGVALLDVEEDHAPSRPTDADPAPSLPPSDDDATLDAGLEAAPELTVQDGFRDPEFQRMAKRYVTEPRDGAWAPDEERRLHETLEAIGWHERGRAHCRKTVCRIELPGASPADLEALLASPESRRLKVGLSRAYEIDNGALQTYTYRERPDGDTR